MAQHQHGRLLDAVKGQPRAVWVTAFAAVIAFMGIGLVDPILKSIGEGLDATPQQVTLLFSSYIFVQVFAMLVTGVFSARYGAKRTVLSGLALIVVFAALSGTATSIAELVGLRAFWGAGNAFFIATALAVIVGAASGGQGRPSCSTRPPSGSACRSDPSWARPWATSRGGRRSSAPRP